MELKAGMFIAQGPETNVLLLLSGEPPLLEVISGIDLNTFQRTGEPRRLDKNSPEIVDIMMHQSDYTFALPSITETINALGFTKGLGKVDNIETTVRDEIIEEGLTFYKEMLPLYGLEQAKVRTRLHIRNKFKIRMEQACYFFTLIAKICNKPLV